MRHSKDVIERGIVEIPLYLPLANSNFVGSSAKHLAEIIRLFSKVQSKDWITIIPIPSQYLSQSYWVA
jgi:hypothetical protein